LGWRTVVGFQTRNPVHRGHEYIQKCALEIVDGLFLHPLVGWKKEDDLPNHLLLKSYELAVTNYYPLERVVLAGFPSRMHYAGPREALYHALCRKNYGCTHFIVGRDHAAVGNYYGPYAAQELLVDLEDELGIVPLPFSAAFWCRVCYGVVTEKTCPHSENARINPSGTAVREALRKGGWIPEEIMRPEIADLLKEESAWEKGDSSDKVI
jgi:sulfate adenylyltransferase